MKSKFYLILLFGLLFACKKDEKNASVLSNIPFDAQAKLEAFKKGDSLSREDIKNFVDYLNKSSAEERSSISKALNEISSKKYKSFSPAKNGQIKAPNVKTFSDEDYTLTTEQILQQSTFDFGTPGSDPYGSIYTEGSYKKYNWTMMNSKIRTWRVFGITSHELCNIDYFQGAVGPVAYFVGGIIHASSSIEGFAPGFSWTELSNFNYCPPIGIAAYFSCDGDLVALGYHIPVEGNRFVIADNVVSSGGKSY